MNITDELREYTKKQIKWLDMTKVHYRKLFSIADRIDAEHQKAIRELNNLADASVLLPVDADGVPIHIGDVMENIVCPSVHREVTGVGVECFYGWDEGNGRYSQFDVVCYRHHHAPTVEDVLREFVERLDEIGSEDDCVGVDEQECRACIRRDIAAAYAEYAARLMLAGEDA